MPDHHNFDSRDIEKIIKIYQNTKVDRKIILHHRKRCNEIRNA